MVNRGGRRTDGWTEGRMEGRKDGRTDGRLEIPPCVLQDIGPLGPLPKNLVGPLLVLLQLSSIIACDKP